MGNIDSQFATDAEMALPKLEKSSIAPRNPPQPTTIDDIRNNRCLWYKLHVLLYDLRNFSNLPRSEERLESITDVCYIGLPYFTAAEAQALKSTMIDISEPVHPAKRNTGSYIEEQQNLMILDKVISCEMEKRLQRRMKKREESGDFRVCAAHDLSPILEKAFGIGHKELAKDDVFLELVERLGLEWEDGGEWHRVTEKAGGKKKKGGKTNRKH